MFLRVFVDGEQATPSTNRTRVPLLSASLTIVMLVVALVLEQAWDGATLIAYILIPAVLLNLFPTRIQWALIGFVPALWAVIFVAEALTAERVGLAWAMSGYILLQLVWIIPIGLVIGILPLIVRLLLRGPRREAG